MNILIVDDDGNIRKTLSYCLAAEGYTVIAVSNPTDAIDEAKRRSFDVAFVDLKLGEANGMDLIPLLVSDSSWTKIVVITAHASIESAVEAMRRGATDYIAKPFTPDQVRMVTRRIGRVRELEIQVAALREDVQRLGPETQLQSRNTGMQRVIEMARKAAPSEAIVLLRGESGTGKSVLARAISSGGFSTQPESIGTWDTAAVEAVMLPLMVLGNLSFVTAWSWMETGCIRYGRRKITRDVNIS